ncbi:MAG: phosphatase PAP2 family protein [Burkholderiales bacterium]|nr:phosphatase PAP2 family protein [Burkholderiales bacterium]
MVICAASAPSRPPALPTPTPSSAAPAPAALRPQPRPKPDWVAELGRRMRWRLPAKALGISAFMWVFFIAYFHLLRHPVRPVLTMPLTALDREIPFQPGWLAAYVSLWLYVGIAPGLMPSLRQALVYGAWMGALCLAGLACFYLWPTAVPPLPAGTDAGRHAGFALLQGVDAAGNACPSLHVACAAFTAVWVDRLLGAIGSPRWLRMLNGLWLALIVYSTLAIKQHVALDALAGLALAAVFALASLRGPAPAAGPRAGR